ncbi:serine/threonine protein kinase [Longibacter salinarum]|nr:serine/threonine protein kinase [Longibacter salinarum]
MYAVVAVPLNRPEVRDFLQSAADHEEARGTLVEVIGQRPTRDAMDAWARSLDELPTHVAPEDAIGPLLSIDSPHTHLRRVPTDRLIPSHFLDDPDFISLNLGGWTPIYFGVVGVGDSNMLGSDAPDPFLQHAETLTRYGKNIAAFGAEREHVVERVQEELDAPLTAIIGGIVRLNALDRETGFAPEQQIPLLVAAIDDRQSLRTADGIPIPQPLLCDALLDRLVRVEQSRRDVAARGDEDAVERHAVQQQKWAAEYDVHIILKGEYVAGRHRRSTICLVPSLGIVIKQPGPEPFHDINLGARTYDGKPENWPVLEKNGAVVTPRGRVRIVLEENVVPRLHAAFNHDVRFSALLGFIIEDHVPGPTLQEYIENDSSRMTEDLYRRVLTTQHVCEALGVNNPDWHSANFIVNEETGDLMHIDWGAARPLPEGDRTEADRDQRIEQVRNFAYSFHDDAIAEQVQDLHEKITSAPEHMRSIRQSAENLAANV